MAKGVMPFSHQLSLGTIGLKTHDLPWFAVEKADVVICVGYDMVEYHPEMWNPNGDKTIVHIDALPAEVDERYILAVGALGDIGASLRGIALRAKPQPSAPFQAVRAAIVADRAAYADDRGFPVKPQKIVWDLREVLGADDIVISDVAHRGMSRMYRAERSTPASSPTALPHGHRRARRNCRQTRYPQRKVVAVIAMPASDELQEIETAWHRHAMRDSDLERFGTPDHPTNFDISAARATFHSTTGFREIRGEFRRQGLPRGTSRGSSRP
jgi:acetolactate synthase-1/2/3 large subunit